MKSLIVKIIVGTLFILYSIGWYWLVFANIRYHFFPIQYEIIASGIIPSTNNAAEGVHMEIISSVLSEIPPFPPEIDVALNQVNLREEIAVVILNEEAIPNIRRVIDISNTKINIKSLLYPYPRAEAPPPPNTTYFLILTFHKEDHWVDEMEFSLWDDEQGAAYVKRRIR